MTPAPVPAPQPAARSTRVTAARPDPPRGGPHPAVVLIGPPGAGKSTVGRELATLIGTTYLDLDAHIEATENSSIPDIFAAHGEDHFRALETAALNRVLTGGAARGSVLALGGGTPVRQVNRDALGEYARRGGTVVFLDVHVDAAVRRLGASNTDRPLLAGDTRERFTELMTARRDAYESAATLQLDTTDIAPTAVAAQIMQHLTNPAPGTGE